MTRDSDTAARLGGDEFALLIENLSDPDAVEAFADRVVTAFSEPFQLSTGSVLTTVTVGVATSDDSADADQLLRHADLALYAAKSAGKRRWHRYAPMLSAGMVRRRELQAALEEAVTKSAFALAYQPIVTLADGHISGLRGPGAVAAPELGTCSCPRPVHRHRRGNRPHHPARRRGCCSRRSPTWRGGAARTPILGSPSSA